MATFDKHFRVVMKMQQTAMKRVLGEGSYKCNRRNTKKNNLILVFHI